ncbi:MAG: hypothetical protein AAFV53_32450 [Myxococcota bacterium]
MLTSDDPDQRSQGRELAVQVMPIERAMTFMDRAAREHHLGEVDRRLAKAPSLSTAVASLLRHRATLLGLDQPQAPPEPTEEDLTPPDDPDDHRLQLLRVARRNRLRAEAGGSWVAAATFLKQERELMAQDIADDDDRSDDELLEEARDSLDELLEEMDEELAAELRDALTGGTPAEWGVEE